MTEKLASRMERYLDRHTEWMRTVLKEMDVLERAIEEDGTEPLLDLQTRRTAEAEHFRREHVGLYREWNDGAGASSEARLRIQRLGKEAEALSEKLQERYQTLMLRVERAKKRQQGLMNDLRRGRDMMDRYRPGGDETGFLDRRA